MLCSKWRPPSRAWQGARRAALAQQLATIAETEAAARERGREESLSTLRAEADGLGIAVNSMLAAHAGRASDPAAAAAAVADGDALRRVLIGALHPE